MLALFAGAGRAHPPAAQPTLATRGRRHTTPAMSMAETVNAVSHANKHTVPTGLS